MNRSPFPAIRLLAQLLLAMLVLRPSTLPARSVFEIGNATVWKYVDEGKEPDAAWRGLDFDDSQWKSGKGPIGYGRTGLGTEVGFGSDKAHKYITTWFRHTFDCPKLKPGERLALVYCVDDGAVFYLNGQEICRDNMPAGPLTADTLAPTAVGTADEGFYLRMPVPVAALRPGRNVLAVEVHQCSANSHDLFLDAALKTMPPDLPAPAVPAAALDVVNTFNHKHYIGPGVKIPDGYLDGGRGMKIHSDGHPTSGREILRVDRTRDVELAGDLAFARSAELKALAPLQRAERLAVRIDQEATPPGGKRWDEKTCTLLEKEFVNKPVFIGDWIDQAHVGVCRHRSLLFKILADEADLKAALVRGNYAHTGSSGTGGAHAWNELFLDDGRRVLVDVMMKGSKQDFPEVSSPKVVSHYRKVDNSAWYGEKADSEKARP